jgi:hypothetical protein
VDTHNPVVELPPDEGHQRRREATQEDLGHNDSDLVAHEINLTQIDRIYTQYAVFLWLNSATVVTVKELQSPNLNPLF